MAELRPGGLDATGDEDVSDLMTLYRCGRVCVRAWEVGGKMA